MKHLAGLFMGLQEHSILRAVLRKYFGSSALTLMVVQALLLCGHIALAAGGKSDRGGS